MHPRPPRLASAVILLAAVAPAHATLLFSFTAGQGGEQPGVTSTLRYRVSSENDPATLLFNNTNWTTDDTGHTVTITRATNPDPFDAFTAHLTDGHPDLVFFDFFPAPAANFSGQGWTESEIVFGHKNDPRTDAQGLTIARYTLTQNALTTTYDPATDRSTFSANITFAAYSDIPEPASLSLLLPALTVKRRRASNANR